MEELILLNKEDVQKITRLGHKQVDALFRTDGFSAIRIND